MKGNLTRKIITLDAKKQSFDKITKVKATSRKEEKNAGAALDGYMIVG